MEMWISDEPAEEFRSIHPLLLGSSKRGPTLGQVIVRTSKTAEEARSSCFGGFGSFSCLDEAEEDSQVLARYTVGRVRSPPDLPVLDTNSATTVAETWGSPATCQDVVLITWGDRNHRRHTDATTNLTYIASPRLPLARPHRVRCHSRTLLNLHVNARVDPFRQRITSLHFRIDRVGHKIFTRGPQAG